ncbi:hypothetical protein [Streptomyces sp. MAR4 CNX-425]|uniref:hypothetical protein n=1 Tax=Streptomyces sp. MAR4 CNX-425 TaxID=3406343 RepID=UPI003B50227D
MSVPQPEPRAKEGQRRRDADELIAAVEEAIAARPMRYRDNSPLPEVGTTPPVTQPGRPPMSQAATDASGLMLAGGVCSLGVGGAVSLVLVASGYADPMVVGLLCATPPVALLSLQGLVKALGKAAKEAAPTEHHHHYTGPVVQKHSTITNHNRWWGRSTTGN